MQYLTGRFVDISRDVLSPLDFSTDFNVRRQNFKFFEKRFLIIAKLFYHGKTFFIGKLFKAQQNV